MEGKFWLTFSYITCTATIAYSWWIISKSIDLGGLSLTINIMQCWSVLSPKPVECHMRLVPCFARAGHIFYQGEQSTNLILFSVLIMHTAMHSYSYSKRFHWSKLCSGHVWLLIAACIIGTNTSALDTLFMFLTLFVPFCLFSLLPSLFLASPFLFSFPSLSLLIPSIHYPTLCLPISLFSLPFFSIYLFPH